MSQCATSAQNTLGNGQPFIEFQTVKLVSPPTVVRDVPVVFKFPHRFIALVGAFQTFTGSGMYIHLAPLYLDKAATDIIPAGTENWIPLGASLGNKLKGIGAWIKFNQPVQTFYFDANQALFLSAVTFAGTDDLEFASILIP